MTETLKKRCTAQAWMKGKDRQSNGEERKTVRMCIKEIEFGTQ